MTRVIASGDHHWQASSQRWGECRRIHEWIADFVEREKPDLFASGGDLYERASTPEEREAVAAWATRIANVCPLIITRGNHDKELDVLLLRRIRAKHPILVEERCGVHVVGGVAVGAIAWPSRANLAAMLGRDVSLDTREDIEREALRDVLRGVGHQLDTHADKPRIGLGHFMCDGAETSTGQPLIGHALSVGLSDLALLNADAVIMAHIHKPQDWQTRLADGRTMPVIYTGSPFRTAYGESEEKSVTVLDFDGPRLAHWERVATPCQPMVLLESEWTDGFDAPIELIDAERTGADVRFRYTAAVEHKEVARAAANEIRKELLDLGAARVTLEAVTRQTKRARTPEITSAKTLPEKLRHAWASRGLDITEEQARRCFAKLEGVSA